MSSTDNPFYSVGSYGDGITVIFGNNVEYIPANLFYIFGSGSIKIKSVVMGRNVESVGNQAFMAATAFDVFYYGTEEVKNQTLTNFGTNNTKLTTATWYYYSETETTGNYWRYVDGVPTPVTQIS